MALETWIVLAAVALLGIVLVVLLRRPTASDPATMQALADLRGALDAQRERLGALQGELKAALAGQGADQSREFSGFTLEQTRLLSEGQAKLERAIETRLAEQRNTQAEQAAASRRDLGEGRIALQDLVTAEMTKARDLIERKSEEGRAQVEAKLKDMREANDARLADIQKSVNEQLASAVEKQMNESFARVIDKFDSVQKAMGDVQAVVGQVGDLKRLFSNVKTRGGWGEAHAKAVLDDILPAGSYETNWRPRNDSGETVEFAVVMPMRGSEPVYLPVDAKFPVEDYERLLGAAEVGDAEGEKAARKALGERLRGEAAKIAAKYICPPRTVEFAVLYLPTDGLYAEAARIAGLFDDIGRNHRVFVLGPSLLPAMLRTIQLGHVTLALGENVEKVRDLLGATKAEMGHMEKVLGALQKQVGTVGRTIASAQRRTRAVTKKLKGVDAISFERAQEVLEIDAAIEEDEDSADDSES